MKTILLNRDTKKNGIERISQWEKEKTGESNIVIGGMGEAEVNTKWTPEKTLNNLISVSEDCGYFTFKGNWTPSHKEIYVQTDQQYRLTYWHDKLECIDAIKVVRQWAV